MKVMIQDKVSRKFTIPGEIVEVKSERSAIVRNSETGSLMLRNRRFLRKDLNFETPIVLGQVLNTIKAVECVYVTPILKSCGNQKHTKKNVTFATQEEEIEKEEHRQEEVTPGAAVAASSSPPVPEWAQVKLQQYIEEGVIERNPNPVHFESRLVNTRVEEFVRDWSRDSIDDTSLPCIRKEREAIRRLDWSLTGAENPSAFVRERFARRQQDHFNDEIPPFGHPPTCCFPHIWHCCH